MTVPKTKPAPSEVAKEHMESRERKNKGSKERRGSAAAYSTGLAVPSALGGFTAGFGMGPGGALPALATPPLGDTQDTQQVVSSRYALYAFKCLGYVRSRGSDTPKRASHLAVSTA